MPTVAISDSPGMLAPAIELLLSEGVEVHVVAEGVSDADLASEVADADAVLVGLRRFPSETIQQLRRVGLIVRCGIGYDIVDVPAATAQGIWVANVPDYCADEVADHTLLLTLAASRRLPEFQRMVTAGTWIPDAYPVVRRLSELTLGVVGFGRIGSRVARRALAVGYTVVVTDPKVAAGEVAAAGGVKVDLHQLLAHSDVVTLHAPLTDATTHLIDDAAFGLMKDGAILINTSRGGLVDLDALHRALVSSRLAAAALDVLDGEPNAPLGHPVVTDPRVIVTPHIAWYSVESSRQLPIKAAEEALRYIRNEELHNAVNQPARAR